MSTTFCLIVNCLLAILAALLGGWLPMLIRFTHRRSQFILSFVSGLMLGVAFFVLLPHALEADGNVNQSMVAMMAGLILMFLMLRMFHFHQHGPVATVPQNSLDAATQNGVPTLSVLNSTLPTAVHDHDHSHDCSHDHDHSHDHSDAVRSSGIAPKLPQVSPDAVTQTSKPTLSVLNTTTPTPVHDHDHSHDHSGGHHHGHDHSHNLSWVAVGFGLSVHTFLDGVMLAASVQADALLHSRGWLGLGALLAIVLHKPLDSMAITSLMAVGGWSLTARQLVNLAYSMTLPLGALVFALTLGQFDSHQGTVVSIALAFSAGALLCIALADLLPEIQFHDHDRFVLSVLLLGGIATAYVTAQIEHAGHSHANHQHSGHDHSQHERDLNKDDLNQTLPGHHDHDHDHGPHSGQMHDHDH